MEKNKRRLLDTTSRTPAETAKLLADAEPAPRFTKTLDQKIITALASPAPAGDEQLRVWVRYRHLEEAGIVRSWAALNDLIDFEGFPAGILLGRNTRAFDMRLVQDWLAARPVARKDVPLRRRTKQTAEA
jgi:hypothetical protein